MKGRSEAQTARRKDGREEASGGGIERGREGARGRGAKEGRKLQGRYPEEGKTSVQYIHKPFHNAALGLDTLVLLYK